MLYSMALHGFHIPLAVLAGIILAKVPRLTPRMRERRLDEAHEEIADGADFAELAGIVSEAPGSAAKGGELGIFGRGRMVAAFEEAERNGRGSTSLDGLVIDVPVVKRARALLGAVAGP